ncbi:hypothetical protein IJV79_02015 [bacterium]|nr:hypothetical protein [bacterium]
MITTTDILAEVEAKFRNEAKTELKVGIELERIPVNDNFEAAQYSGEHGVCKVLKEFSRAEGWDYITDGGMIIGLKNDSDTITLEPGCQFELSIAPEECISMLKNKIDKINRKLTPVFKKHDIKLLGYGISPKTTYRQIELLPKQRYFLMAKCLWGILSDVMMRETAGIQVCYDYKSEEDAVRKLRIANILSPFVSAICANSPIRGGVDTGYKSFRNLSWLNTDSERCPFMSKKLFENKYSFKTYSHEVLKTPMVFINRETPIFINGKINFEQFLKHGYEGYHATVEDFNLQANLYFPDVRLRNFIEIRNHDCSNNGMQYALMALYKGILYNDEALSAVENLLSKFSYYQIAELRYCVPKTALQTKIGRNFTNDIARELVKISHTSLRENFRGEENFLEPIMEIAEKGTTRADIILKNWNGSWNKDLSKLISYVSEK